MKTNAIVRTATKSDARFHWEHMRRHFLESGRDGDFIFIPMDEPFEVPFDVFEKSYGEKINRPVTEVDWERVWVIADENGIYGELRLVHRPPLRTCLHRATLMMGIERTHRGHGFGSTLMTEALTWAKSQPTLEWLQLFVFSENIPARKLYEKFGFREIGTTPDMFRPFGRSVDDISMILRIR